MRIAGIKVPSPEKVIKEFGSSVEEATGTAAEKATEAAGSVADKATDGVKEAIASKIGEAAEALKVTLADSDGDGQEHNEL